VTREQFVAKAVREAERALHVPAGWWGTWREVHSPDGGVLVRFSAGVWLVVVGSLRVSRHDSRSYAIKKAQRHAQGLA
jgi:hypothetical protein